jgi:FecR protein
MTAAMKVLFGSCALALAGLFLAPGFALGQENPAGPQNSPADDPPARVARLSYLKGSVSFLRAGVDQWSQAAINFPVTTGDRIYTEKDGRAELQVGNYTVRLSHQTDLSVTNLSDQVLQLGLEQGTLRLTTYQIPSGETVEIDTPNGVLTVQQPGTYRVEVDPSGERTMAYVNSGSVEVTGGGVSKTLQSGQAVDLTGYDVIKLLPIPPPPPDEFDRWCDDRDASCRPRRLVMSAGAFPASRSWMPTAPGRTPRITEQSGTRRGSQLSGFPTVSAAGSGSDPGAGRG